MKRIFGIIQVMISTSVFAQNSGSIQFYRDAGTWQEVIAKAKAENKYIFIDYFASWCVPCKKMDKEVYTNDSVGNFYNAKFINLKIQGDTTSNDDSLTKQWYGLAHDIIEDYNITAFPSFMFFSPDGKIVHKGVGYMDIPEFIKLAEDATNPSEQYFVLKRKYLQDTTQYSLIPKLALKAYQLEDQRFSNDIIENYKQNFIDKASDSALCTRQVLQLLDFFPKLILTEGSKSRMFQILYHHPELTDKLIDENVANFYFKRVITKEEIEDPLASTAGAKAPDWKDLYKRISNKYGDNYAAKIIPPAQVDYYMRTNNWKEFVNTINSLIKTYPPKKDGKEFGKAIDVPLSSLIGDAWGLNTVAWYVFQHCNSKTLLKKALEWSVLSIEIQPTDNLQYLDTKANLQYKLGYVQNAIKTEKFAIQTGIEQARKRGETKGDFFDEYTATVKKMEKGIPTW